MESVQKSQLGCQITGVEAVGLSQLCERIDLSMRNGSTNRGRMTQLFKLPCPKTLIKHYAALVIIRPAHSSGYEPNRAAQLNFVPPQQSGDIKHPCPRRRNVNQVARLRLGIAADFHRKDGRITMCSIGHNKVLWKTSEGKC